MSTIIDEAALDLAMKALFPVYLKGGWAKVDRMEEWIKWHFNRVYPTIVAEYHRQRQAAWGIKSAEGYWVHSSCGFWGLTDQHERADRFPSKVEADRALERSALPTQIRLLGRVEQIPPEPTP